MQQRRTSTLPSASTIPSAFIMPILLIITAQFVALGHCSSGHAQDRLHHHTHLVHTLLSPRNDKMMAKCHLDEISTGQPLHICDIDGMLTAEDKATLNLQLVKLAEQIEKEADDEEQQPCGWAIYMGIAVVENQLRPNNQFQFQSKDPVEKTIRHQWALDPRTGCQQRTIQLLLVTSLGLLTAWNEPNLPVLKEELDTLIGHQAELLKQKDFARALSNVILGVQRLASHRMRLLSGQPEPGGGHLPLAALILAFLIALAIVELARCSLRPKFDQWMMRRRQKADDANVKKSLTSLARHADEEDPEADLDRGLTQSQRILSQRVVQLDQVGAEHLEMAEQQMGNNGNTKFTIPRPTPKPRSPSSSTFSVHAHVVQIQPQAEERC